jgi:shikimate dehydrogenase
MTSRDDGSTSSPTDRIGIAPDPRGAATKPPVVTLCGSIARLAGPLGRSVHEAGYHALGLAYAYVPFAVTDLPGAVTGMRALGIRGFGVSQPYKQQVMTLVDAVEPVAERIGAVNTIVNTGGRLVGHNTDWMGAMRALEEVRALGGARVFLLGAGGAARAIAFGLHARGAVVTIANRDAPRAEALARDTGAQGAGLDEAARAGDYDVIVNATNVGQSDTVSPGLVASETLHPGQVVLDIVYKPIRTPLLEAARSRGATVVHGGRMLLHQAAAQFELYTGVAAPLEAMDAALRAAIG